MNDSRVEVEARGYLRINTFNKLMLFVLNAAILSSYLMGYTNKVETCGLFFIGLLINATLLKMAVTHVKSDAVNTGYVQTGSTAFDILNKFSEDLRNGTPHERMEYRKKNSLLAARLDATATLIVAFGITFIFWVVFVIKAFL